MKNKGVATLEILIAMTIILMALSAVVLTSSGNQNILVDGQTNREALSKAEELIETSQALSRKDFKLVNPIASTTDEIYEKALYVKYLNSFTKKITAVVSWQTTNQRKQNTSISAIITNFENAVGGDTCNSFITGDWTNPTIKNLVQDFGQLIGDTGSTYTLSGVDAYLDKLYITAGSVSAPNKETFFIFDIKNKDNPTILGRVDNAITVSAGLSKVVVATSTGKHYAYVSNNYGASFNTCDPGPNCSQLQVINISNPASPTVSASFEIPTSTTPFVTGSGGQAVGNSIFYKDGYIYLGLTKTGNGPEFNIIDVHDPLNPFWVGGYSVGNTVNNIFARGKYVYIASPNPQELITLDVSDPANPLLVGGYDAPDAVGNGKSIYSVGDKIYLGRTNTAANPEFYVLNNIIPNSSIPSLGTKEIGSSVNSLIVRDYLAFTINTTSQFKVFNILDPANITDFSLPLSLPTTGGSIVPSLDCEGNYFFAITNNLTNKGFLYSITSQP